MNVPVTDNFFVAAAFSLNKRDGWQENTGPGKDFSAIDGTSGRLDARWLPTDKITLECGGASMTMKSDGNIEIKGANLTLKGSGNIVVKGSNIGSN